MIDRARADGAGTRHCALYGFAMRACAFSVVLCLVLAGQTALGADATPEESLRADANACHETETASLELIETCSRAIRSEAFSGSDLAWLHSSRGWWHEQMGDGEAARADYRISIRTDPDYLRARYNLGWLEGELQNWEGALAVADALVERDAQSGYSHGMRGWALRNLGQHENALDSLTISLALEPSDDWVMRELAYAHLDLGAPEDALDYAERAEKADPADAWSPYTIGYVHSNQERFELAIGYFDRAIGIDASNIEFLIERGYALAQLQRHAEALSDFESAIALDPQDFRPVEQIAWVELAQEKYEQAEATFVKTVSMMPPGRANPHYGLASTLAALGRSDEALAALQAGLDVSYQDWNAREVLRVLLREGAMLSSVTASRMINKAARKAEE